MKEKPLLAIVTASDELQILFSNVLGESFNLDFYRSPTSLIETIETENRKYNLIFSDLDLQSQGCYELREARQTNHKLADVPFVLLLDSISNDLKRECMNMRISDFVLKPIDVERLKTVIACEIGLTKCEEIPKESKPYHLSANKRIFDIVVSGLALILFFPLFLIVGILTAAISKSSPFVGNNRVGMGAKTFKLWQFRTTYKEGDKRQYCNKQTLQGNPADKQPDRSALLNKKCPECEAAKIPCQQPQCFDDGIICEKLQHIIKKPAEKEVINEPGIHPFGKYLKKMKIENLPQLWNVFIGDMSIVGNDPVTVCEFIQLTFNEDALRFCAPAGMLSLMKVMKTHNGALAEKARLTYDRDYAARAETGGLLLYDILLIMKWITSSLVRRLSSDAGEKQ